MVKFQLTGASVHPSVGNDKCLVVMHFQQGDQESNH